MDGFKEKYKEHYGGTRKVIVEKSLLDAGISSFRDSKACSECKQQGKDCCETEENLRISHNCSITKVELEKFFTQFDGTSRSSLKDKCDILLFDDKGHRIAFCEMTCSQNKYIEPYDNSKGHQVGKRAKAYQQLKSSIDKLAKVPDIASSMNRYDHRTALFAVRHKDSNNQKESFEISNVNKFIIFPKSIQANAKSDIGNGFSFEVVEYPTIYQW